MFRLLRWAYGGFLIAVLFVPFGVFHTMVEPYVVGALWGLMLPVGYVSAASGVALILYSRSKSLKNLGLGYLLMLSGALMLLSALFPRELSISLLYGTNAVDMEYSIFNGTVVWLALINIAAGLVIKATTVNHSLRRSEILPL
jgi:hypothetical protein